MAAAGVQSTFSARLRLRFLRGADLAISIHSFVDSVHSLVFGMTHRALIICSLGTPRSLSILIIFLTLPREGKSAIFASDFTYSMYTFARIAALNA